MLSDDPAEVISQTTALVNANASLGLWVQGLSSSHLSPLDPPPSWYSDVETAIETAKQQAGSFWSTQAPQNFAAFTQSLISHANLFLAAAPKIKALVAEAAAEGGCPDDVQQSDLAAFVEALADSAQQQQQAVAAATKSMQSLHDSLATLTAALNTAYAAAREDEAADYMAIEQVMLQIGQIQAKLGASGANVDTDRIAAGKGMASVVVALTIGLVISGGTLGLGGLAFTILGIGASAVSAELADEDVQRELNQLTQLMEELSADQLQLALVQNTMQGLTAMIEVGEKALNTFDSFSDIWNIVSLQLGGLQVVLDQPKIDVARIPDLNNLDQAAAAWTRISNFATAAQAYPIHNAAVELPQLLITPTTLKVA